MKRLLIVGAGGHGRVVADVAREMGVWDKIAFIDANYSALSKSGDWPVVGTDSDAVRLREQYSDLFVAVGDGKRRGELLRHYLSQGFTVPVIAHPKASISAGAKLAPGTIVMAQSVVNYGTQIGIGGIINTSASVDHDCLLGDSVHICPGVHLAGGVSVGDCSWVGIGSNIIQQLRIGAGVVIGAGAAVIGDIPDGATACGVPAKIIKC